MTLLYFALVCLIGVGLLRFLFPSPLRWSLHNALTLSLGAGIGMGIASCLSSSCLTRAGPNIALLAAVEAAVVIAVVVLASRAKPGTSLWDWAPGPPPSRTLNILFWAAVAIAASSYVGRQFAASSTRFADLLRKIGRGAHPRSREAGRAISAR